MNATPENEQKPATRWASGRRILIAAVLANACLVAVAFAYAQWHQRVDFESTDNAYIKGNLTYVSPKVSGYVTAVETENNRKVAPGDVLVRIDPSDYQVAVQTAVASVAQQNASLVQLDQQQQLQQAQIKVSEAGVTSAQASLSETSADFKRAQALVEQGAISQQEFDQSKAAWTRARAALAQNQSQVDYAQQQMEVLRAERTVIDAQLKSAQATLQRANNDLAWTQIRAPREGLVAARNVRLGEYVTAGTRLMAIAPTRDLWIEANLRETQLARMRQGDRVQVQVDAVPDQTYCGYVESISGASGSEFAVIPPDNASGNFTKIVRRFPVRILLDADQPGLQRLGVGMSVEPRVALGSSVDGEARPGLLSRVFLGSFTCDKQAADD
ncbi:MULTISPECIES: HlyD family secretion protein [Pseudomonas]|uniref:HlyD family secretion protein n=1 Tax=Pseudomonas TaxID=286 RepID=UPI0002D5FE7C|nr:MULTISPECIES: HlyD family secretion protein [Pseudomonas]